MDTPQTILITLITAVTSAGAWQFYQSRLKMKHAETQAEKAERTMFRDDLRERVVILEQKLEQAQADKEELNLQLGKVLGELREYKVRLELLEEENELLRNRG